MQNYQTKDFLDFNEFHEARNIVNRRFGFDYDWLVCMSLIQLHENLIKKKISKLKGEIKENEPIYSLIKKVSSLIKKQENREVSFGLLLSNGIKTARDTMSHEGYKYPVSKKDLSKLIKEIKDLEEVLFPMEKSQLFSYDYSMGHKKALVYNPLKT